MAARISLAAAGWGRRCGLLAWRRPCPSSCQCAPACAPLRAPSPQATQPPLPLTLPFAPLAFRRPRPRLLPSLPCLLEQEVGYAITRLPEGFTPHRQIAKVYEARRHMVDSGEGLDWGMAEALAFGTLLAEGGCGGGVGWDGAG